MKIRKSYKRKRIAVFLGEIGRDFQRMFLEHLKSCASSCGYDVFVFNNFGAFESTVLFDAGERDVINIPEFSDFSGVISLPDTFDIAGMESKLISRIKATSDCPIVSVRNGALNTYRVVFDNYGTLYSMTEHFLKVHGYKNICYMSGPYKVGDSVDRLNGFKDAMEDAGLTVPEDAIFEGDFWKRHSVTASDQFLKAYDGKCEAIICANDYMAIGIIDELRSRGINIPGDIAISGFDGTIEGQAYVPPLTTVDIPIEKMVEKALDIIGSVCSGNSVSMENSLVGNIDLRGSCGCDCEHKFMDISKYVNKITNEYAAVRQSTMFTSDIHTFITEAEKLSFANTYTDIFQFTKNYLCLCTDEHKDDNPYSEVMKLRCIFPFVEEIGKTNTLDIMFDRRQILPDTVYDNSKPSMFIVYPVHHKNQTYGYMVSEWVDGKDFTMFMAPYAEGLALAYSDLDIQTQFSEFVEIKKQNLIDPLTGIDNRRSFEQSVSALTTLKGVNSKFVSFVSVDLDNLKLVNDNYGHHEGDIAIKAIASILSEAVGPDNICARVGGDEFYAVIMYDDISMHESFPKLFYELLEKKRAELDKPYDLHASLGMNTVTIDMIGKAFEHLQVADKRMYTEKKKYKEQNS